MRIDRTNILAASLALIIAAGAASAADAPAADAAAPAAAAAPAKPVLPSVSDLLDASGITATGYVSGTFDYQGFSGSNAEYTQPPAYNTFTLQQAAFTLAKQPTSGFGGLVNVLAGQNIYTPNYAVSTAYTGGRSGVTSTQFQIAQAYAQWAGGPLTVIAGKFVTIVGAEGLASPGNTNVTRSLLYSFEPVTHTGARLTWAATSTLNVIAGLNNGWNGGSNGNETAARSDLTAEAGLAWTPNKIFAWTLGGYYGRDTNNAGIPATQSLLDTVLTWTATSALTAVLSADLGQADQAYGLKTSSASWYGMAAYLNYAMNDTWRVSLRGEYYDDKDGYLTLYSANANALGYSDSDYGAAISSPVGQNLYEGTVTFGYDPTKNIELRLEGRYDTYNGNAALKVPTVDVYQGWLEALYHF